ncbi:MAG: PAQR family membrane homeostasis protein TrhA [Trebonia sp.]
MRSQSANPAPQPGQKPRLRGWIHALAAPAALAAGIVLTARAPTAPAAACAAVFTITAVELFAVSAVYHVGTWSPRVQAVLRRTDHVDILFLIAGTYTPVTVLALHGRARLAVLCVIWGGAVLGAGFRLAWIAAPRWIYLALYLSLGWTALLVLPELLSGAGPAPLVLLAAGGLLYTLGGLAYGFRHPDPWPRWFGYHEVFHACTVAAFTCQYLAVWMLVGHS